MQRAIGIAAVLLCCVAGAQAAGVEPRIATDEIGGNVRSPRGAEAGVWVIAETHDFQTRFAKIVVTDEAGRYLIPDLPPAKYSVWVRGYGLADSPARSTQQPGQHLESGRQRRSRCRRGGQDLSGGLLVRDDEDSRRRHEPAALPGGRNGYLMWMKNMGCIGCHQLGNLATRTIPEILGHVQDFAGGVAAALCSPDRPAAR